MNVFGRPHWLISQHFPNTQIYCWHKLLINLTSLAHGNYILHCYLVNMFYTYVTENQRVMNTNYYWVSLRNRGRHVEVMNVSSTDRDGGKTDMFMHQIFNDFCCTPENGSKMHYWTHSTKLNKSLRNTPASYWRLFQIESQHTPHFISRILCAQTGSWHI